MDRWVESSEDVDSVSVALFGSRLQLAQTYADLLTNAGLERGLIGPREVERLWTRHLLNCAAVGQLVPEDARLADIGSGAGLPGIVLAIARPDIDVVVVESRLRPTQFLTECVDILQLSSVTVRRARAEAMVPGFTADVVTARAVAPLSQLLEWSMPMLRPGGQLLALKGDRAEEELEGARAKLTRWGAPAADVVRVGEGLLDPPTTVVRVVAGSPKRRRRA